MKIWFPAIRANSGADVYTERLAAGLKKIGVDVEITWFPPSYEFLPELMRRHAIPAGTDVIHANSWYAAVFIGRGVPVATTVHHLVHDPEFRPYRSVLQAAYHAINVYGREKRAIVECNAVISVSENTASTVKGVFGIDSTVIPNWIDVDRFHPMPVKSANGKFTLLIVGNRGYRKGSDLLPAFSKELGADFEIRITGGLRGTKGKTEFMDNIVILGHVDEDQLLAEFRRCDAVVSLSRYEGFGYTALEAMACAKPFLGFNASGLNEVVVNNETGILCDIGDTAALAECCKLLAENSELRATYGENGLNRATKNYSQKKLVGMYMDIYSGIISAAS